MPGAIFDTKAEADKYKRYLRNLYRKGGVTIHKTKRSNEVSYTRGHPAPRVKKRK
jgi:hypothetical protein